MKLVIKFFLILIIAIVGLANYCFAQITLHNPNFELDIPGANKIPSFWHSCYNNYTGIFPDSNDNQIHKKDSDSDSGTRKIGTSNNESDSDSDCCIWTSSS